MSRLRLTYGRNKLKDSTKTFLSHMKATADMQGMNFAQNLGPGKQVVDGTVHTPGSNVEFTRPLQSVKPGSRMADPVRQGVSNHNAYANNRACKRSLREFNCDQRPPDKKRYSPDKITHIGENANIHGQEDIPVHADETASKHKYRHRSPSLSIRVVESNTKSKQPESPTISNVMELDSDADCLSEIHLPSPPLTSQSKSTSPDSRVSKPIRYSGQHDLRTRARKYIQGREGETWRLSDNSNILSLPDDILTQILFLVPESGDQDIFQPWLKNGMHRYGLSGISLDFLNGDLVDSDNVDLNFLRVNKRFYELGTTAVYSMHKFFLSDSYSADFWLRTIGPRNISKIRVLRLNIGTDWKISRMSDGTKNGDWSPPCDKCEEESWLRIISKHIQPYQNLDWFVVWLLGWESVSFVYPKGTPRNTFQNDFDRERIMDARLRLLEFLGSAIRGINRPEIHDEGRVWLNRAKAHQMMAHMQLPKTTARVSEGKKPGTLSQALAQGAAYVKRRNAMLAEAEYNRKRQEDRIKEEQQQEMEYWRARRKPGMDL